MKPRNPVMAAMLAASSAALVLSGTAFADDAANCAKNLDKNNAVNAVDCLIRVTPGAYEDVGARLAAFVLEKDYQGRTFVKASDLKDKTLVAQISAVAKAWPKVTAQTQPKNNIAALYVVVVKGSDPETLPAWTQVPELKEKLKPGDLRKRLEIALSAETDKSVPARKDGDGTAGKRWTGDAQITASGAADAVAAFLNDAAAWSAKIFDDQRSTATVSTSVEDNDTTAIQVPTMPGRPNPLDTTGAGFGFNDLYGPPAAVVANVYGPKDDGYRTLSIKMYTVKNDDGSLQNMIGIVDITDPAAPYAPKFVPITQDGPATIQLSDGGRKYTVDVKNVDGQHQVSISRKGSDPKYAGSATGFSIEDLARARADQAARAGVVRVPDPNGDAFYALAQGGENGSVLFFPKDLVDNRADAKDARFLRPVAMGDVSKVDNDGLTVPMDGKPDVGKINGKPYHLQFDDKTKMWKVAEGEGDKKKKKDEPAGSTTTVKGGGQKPPTAGGGTTTDDADTLDRAVELATGAGYAETGNESDSLKSKIRILTKDGTTEVLIAPELNVNSAGQKLEKNAWEAGNLVDAQGNVLDEFVSIRTHGDFVVATYKKQALYMPIDNFLAFTGRPDPKNFQPPQGFYKDGAGVSMAFSDKQSIPRVPSVDLAADVLTHYFKVPADSPAIQKLKDGAAAHAGDKPYVVSGTDKEIYVKVGNTTWQVWPKDFEVKAGEGGNSDAQGPGVVYVAAGGPLDKNDPYPEHIDKNDRVSFDKDTGIGLYKGKTDDGKDNWSLLLEFKKSANGDNVGSGLLTVFAQGSKDFLSLPSGYHLKGIKDKVAGNNAVLKNLAHSTQGKGAWVLYLTPADAQSTKNRKANCLGAVVWWGMDEAAAVKACQGDGEVP